MQPWGEPEATAKPTYQYEELPNDHSIRMLTLCAGEPGTPLHGKLSCFDIDSNDDYETISYTWGELDRSAQIVCDSGFVGITASLEGALERLRWTDGERRLWVDQICIDQDNKEERSQQVQFMNRQCVR